MDLFKSRKFWLLLIDFVAIVGGFVVKNYLPQYQDAIVLIVSAAQPLVLYFLAQFTTDDTVAKIAKVFGKTLPLILILITLFAFAPSIALADSPQPYQYAMVQCSGLGTVENVQFANQAFDTWYGTNYNLKTDGDWKGSYIARVNNFAVSVGCPTVLVDDGSPTGRLSFWYQIYVPWYQRFSPSYAALKAAQVK